MKRLLPPLLLSTGLTLTTVAEAANITVCNTTGCAAKGSTMGPMIN